MTLAFNFHWHLYEENPAAFNLQCVSFQCQWLLTWYSLLHKNTYAVCTLFYTMYMLVSAPIFDLCTIKVWIIVQLAEDADSSNDIRVLGGIPLLLALLQWVTFRSLFCLKWDMEGRGAWRLNRNPLYVLCVVWLNLVELAFSQIQIMWIFVPYIPPH